MNYEIIFSPRAERQLDKIGREQRVRILRRIVALEGDPRPHGCIKLRGFDRLYRIREGEFRIIFKIDDEDLTVAIAKIGRREKDTYRRMR